ncbi:hypothetical protein RCL_jg20750.t1 [Rhizophagus clarus]|uniref:Uncharacterized protein n=1 Tax=Rhizophagus clarus TaxID=94130 RepID=A0A8H3LIR2_9GLOM|nr:hypothetical protein RCL_jg20750.t1 [Rhizophagus clarus]
MLIYNIYNYPEINSISPHHHCHYYYCSTRRNKSRYSVYFNYSDSYSSSQPKGRSTTKHHRDNDIKALSRAITTLMEEVYSLKKSQTRNDF